MCTCGTQSLIPRPLSTEERPGTHCLHMREIFHYIFRKKLCALPCPYAEDYTNQEYRAFFELDSSDDLTYRTLLGYYFQTWQYHFSKCTVQQKGNKLVYQSGPFRAGTEILISLCTRFVAAPPWTQSAFTTEVVHDTALPSSESAVTLSFVCVKWTCTVCIRN